MNVVFTSLLLLVVLPPGFTACQYYDTFEEDYKYKYCPAGCCYEYSDPCCVDYGSSSSSDELPIRAILGIVFGCIIVVGVVIFLVCLKIRKSGQHPGAVIRGANNTNVQCIANPGRANVQYNASPGTPNVPHNANPGTPNVPHNANPGTPHVPMANMAPCSPGPPMPQPIQQAALWPMQPPPYSPPSPNNNLGNAPIYPNAPPPSY